jgi:hypothetical protein
MYTNNTDNPDNDRSSSVSHCAAAGLGELGPCGVQHSAGMVPIPIENMGPCGTLSADTAPSSIATAYETGEMVQSGVQYSAERTKFDPNYESGGMAPRGVQHSAMVAISDPNDNHYEIGGVEPNGVQYAVRVPTYDYYNNHGHGEAGPSGVQYSARVTTFDLDPTRTHSPVPIIYDPAGADSFVTKRTAHNDSADARDADVKRGSPAYNRMIGGNSGTMVQKDAGSVISPGSDHDRRSARSYESQNLIRYLSAMMSSPQGIHEEDHNEIPQRDTLPIAGYH